MFPVSRLSGGNEHVLFVVVHSCVGTRYCRYLFVQPELFRARFFPPFTHSMEHSQLVFFPRVKFM